MFNNPNVLTYIAAPPADPAAAAESAHLAIPYATIKDMAAGHPWSHLGPFTARDAASSLGTAEICDRYGKVRMTMPTSVLASLLAKTEMPTPTPTQVLLDPRDFRGIW